MKSIIIAISVIFLCSCSEHHVDSFPKWCEQINGVDLQKKYEPFWSVIFSVSFDGDAIRDDFVSTLNQIYLEKIQNRAPKMVWREGTDLHITNISGFLAVDTQVTISEYQQNINLCIESKLSNDTDICLYGTITSMFDKVHIHSLSPDALGVKWSEEITTIDTYRKKRLGDQRL